MQIKKIIQFFKNLIISVASIIWWKLWYVFVEIFLLQYLKIVKVYRSCMWLYDFMFCNTCILFFELFGKVLGLGFFYDKIMIFLKIFFGLGSKLETNQAFQPLTPPCPLNMAWKDKEWMKVGLKWKCKVGICIATYCVKWLFNQAFERDVWLGGKKG